MPALRAVFALPLQVGGDPPRRAWTSTGHGRDRFDRDQLADALLLADTACALLLDTGSTRRRRGGREPELAGPQHPEVHQATGMIIVQLGVTAAVALIRLRAYAYAHDRRLRDVAADVVARRLRFTLDR